MVALADSAAVVNDLPTPGAPTSTTIAPEARATGTHGLENGQQFGQHSQTTSCHDRPQDVSMMAHAYDLDPDAQPSIDSTVSPDMSQNVNGPAGIRTRTALSSQRILSPLRLPIPPQGRG